MESPGAFDPEDLIYVIAGMLYSIGHYPIQLNEQSMRRAVPAAAELLSALGIEPKHWRDERDEYGR